MPLTGLGYTYRIWGSVDPQKIDSRSALESSEAKQTNDGVGAVASISTVLSRYFINKRFVTKSVLPRWLTLNRKRFQEAAEFSKVDIV